MESGLTLRCGVTDNHFQGSLGQGQPERRCFSDSETVGLSHLAEKETEALRNENWIVVHLGALEQVCVCVCVCVCVVGGSRLCKLKASSERQEYQEEKQRR